MGTACLRGREVGVPTPMNEAVVAFTRRIEAGELTPDPANFGLLTGHL
jgi:hypothetical protein